MGKFIVVEGLDRSGKSTMTHFLQRKLSQQSQTISLGFPNRTTQIGLMINEFLKNKVQMSNETIHLLFSANRWQAMKQFNTLLDEGKNIICDRYWYSGVAYSHAKGLNLDWCMSPDRGLRQPDLIIFLKADPNKLAEREGYGNERFQKIQFQIKVQEAFNKIIEKIQNPNLKVIEIDFLGIQMVQQQISKLIEQHFQH